MTWEPKNKLDDEDVDVSDDDDKDRDDDKNGKSSNSTPSNILLLVLKCNGFTFSEYSYELNDVRIEDSISSSNTSSLFTLNAATRTNAATSIVVVTEENSCSGFGGVKQF